MVIKVVGTMLLCVELVGPLLLEIELPVEELGAVDGLALDNELVASELERTLLGTELMSSEAEMGAVVELLPVLADKAVLIPEVVASKLTELLTEDSVALLAAAGTLLDEVLGDMEPDEVLGTGTEELDEVLGDMEPDEVLGTGIEELDENEVTEALEALPTGEEIAGAEVTGPVLARLVEATSEKLATEDAVAFADSLEVPLGEGLVDSEVEEAGSEALDALLEATGMLLVKKVVGPELVVIAMEVAVELSVALELEKAMVGVALPV